MKKNLVQKFALFATAVSLLFTLPASAQDDLEEIVVTGSYITRPADRPQPVTVLARIFHQPAVAPVYPGRCPWLGGCGRFRATNRCSMRPDGGRRQPAVLEAIHNRQTNVLSRLSSA